MTHILRFFPAAAVALLPLAAHAQVGIGTTTPNAAAALDITATDKGLLLPRLSLSQRNALTASSTAPPVPGLVIYQTDNTPGVYAYDGTGWVRLGADNLGNHTANQALNLQGNALTGTGSSVGTAVGVGVRADGGLNLGQNTPGNTVALGYQAGQSSTGSNNVFLGVAGGFSNGAGADNTALGFQAGRQNQTGSANLYAGRDAGYNATGSNNTALGYQAGVGTTSGENNAFVGYQAGRYNTSGGNNTALGYLAGPASGSGALSNATALGYQAQVTTSNSLVLGGTGTYGVNVGIGNANPNRPLTVQANVANDVQQWRSNGGTNRWHLGVVPSGSSHGLNFAETGVADNRLFLEPGGNVGLGTNDPTRLLDVNGSTRLRGLTTPGVVTTDASGNLGSEANQTLSLSGQTLSISGTGGNSVTLPSGGGSPTGAAGGALTGTYPNPTLAAGVVATTELADNAVTNAKVADNAINAAKLANGAVTIPKLAATGTPSGSTYLRGDNTWATIAAWSLTGNATDGSQFIGTTNDQDFFVKRNGAEAFRVYSNGRVSLGNSTPSSSSVLLGFNAGVGLTSSLFNVIIGARAGQSITDSNANGSTFVGYGAGQSTTGGGNTLMGYYAGYKLTSGTNNVFIGNQTAYNSSTSITGGNNVVVGTGSGNNLTSNDNNILLGGNAQASAGLYDAYAIGYNATVTQGNSLLIGGLRGGNDAVNVGIGVAAPSSTLHVQGTFAVGVVSGVGGGTSGNPNNLDQGRLNTQVMGGYYSLNPSASTPYYTLPDPASCPGRIYYVRNGSSSVTAIFIVSSGQLIDGASSSGSTTYSLNTTGSSKTVTILSDGTNWLVLRTGGNSTTP